ncbi:hypothetical protein AVEN_231290-1 [Araneus ventricosus]|uniref:Uncharacterized protein n=1 Tax=Araneus ventricosus TaxID=182803 RepID=A0A4Y2CHB5_ARAVE|nr:hypothetical protein AVEN_231290-1 [Araneus ventricosus]
MFSSFISTVAFLIFKESCCKRGLDVYIDCLLRVPVHESRTGSTNGVVTTPPATASNHQRTELASASIQGLSLCLLRRIILTLTHPSGNICTPSLAIQSVVMILT